MQIKHYIDVLRLNRILADFPMLNLLDDTMDLGFEGARYRKVPRPTVA